MSNGEEIVQRIISVRDVCTSYDSSEWGFRIAADVVITTPEQEPATVMLKFETRVKSHPVARNEDLAGWLLEVLADRLQRPLRAPD